MLKPKTPFDIETGKGKGAWELGLRYDQFEVDNTSIANGTNSNSRFQGSTNNQVAAGLNTSTTNGSVGGAKTYTAGIKWILNPNMRVLLNYSHTKYDYAFRPIDVAGLATVNTTINTVDSEDLVMLRTQLSF